MQRFRVVSWLTAAVALLLCILLGIGCYVLVVAMAEKPATVETPVNEEIIIIEGKIRDPETRRQEEIKAIEEVEPLAHIKHISDDMRTIPASAGSENAQENTLLNTIAALADAHSGKIIQAFNSEESTKYVEQTLRLLDDFASQFTNSDDEPQEENHSRNKRSIISMGVLSMFPYLSYASFGKFVFKQVSEIAQYKIESRTFQARKLGGDSEADFLDGFYSWPSKSHSVKKDSARNEEETNVENVAEETQETKKPWSPLVNQVPVSFVGEILRTLLNLMKEFLMKDHVMECLWFMFCQDVNHQAQYSDVYGILARVNSVGLKVLTESDQQLRESDTFHEIWRSVTAWTPLQCDAMFPRCDGSKALEIVNEVALGSNQ